MREADAIETAVRGFLEHRGPGENPYATSHAADYCRLSREELRSWGNPNGVAPAVRRLEAVSSSGDTAEAALDAIVRYEVVHPEWGRVRGKAKVTGPVKLLRVDDRWRVADYQVDGRSISDSFFPLAGEPAELRHVSLRGRGLLRQGLRILAFLEIENRGGTPARLVAAWLGHGRGRMCRAGLSRQRLAPGERAIVVIETSKWAPRRMPRVEAILDVEPEEGGEIRFRVRLAPHDGSASAAAGSRRPLFGRRLRSALQATAILHGLVLLGVVYAKGDHEALGVMLTFVGAILVYSTRGVLRMPDRLRSVGLFTAAGALFLACGVALLAAANL